MEKMNIPKYARADYYGLAAIALCNAAIHYDPCKGSFKSNAITCIRNEINMERNRLFQSEKRKSNFATCSLDDENTKFLLEKQSYDNFKNNFDLQCTFSDVINRCTYRETETMLMIARGYKHEEIAQKLGLSVSGVKRIVSRVRGKFKEEGIA